jgi:S-DNA-T family DNA segregation ATPase FtsK/SpoIIIE
VTRTVAHAFEDRHHDVWGIGFVALGLVAALSIYADVAGPLGSAIDDGFAYLFGLLRVLLPVAFVALGISVLRGPRRAEADHEVQVRYARVVVGGVIAVLSVAGFAHVFGGRPSFGDPVEAFADAGGVVGLALGGPLVRLLLPLGATLVLTALFVIGATLFVGHPVRDVAGFSGNALRGLGQRVASGFRGLFSVADDDDDAEDDLEYDDVAVHVPANELDDEYEDETEYEDDEEDETEYEEEAEYEDEEEDDDVEVVVAGPKAATRGRAAPKGEQLSIALGAAAEPNPWKLPPANLLKRGPGRDGVDLPRIKERGRLLERTLAEHGVETRLVGMVVGPTVTRYELELGPGVKVARVTSLNRDIAYAMASPDVRILAPIPGKQAIGVEVPNENREVVAIGDILASAEAKTASHPLEVAIGRDINGKAILANLAAMPHLLIAGATGAGKSSCINSLITSILMRSTPDQVRLILIDPKMVEMGQYDKIPHLLTAVVTDPKKAANALAWAVREMERRYELLAKKGFRDIVGYNNAYDKDELHAGLGEVGDDGEPLQYQRLTYILVVVDELADLMMVAARDVEESICRIAQKARAVGIHLVIATQRPSVNVITGLIKANVPARLAFAVSSQTDSRVVLDQPGAERLVGKGDMLLLTPASSSPNRIQGCWVSEEEVRAVVGVWRKQVRALPTSAGRRDTVDETGAEIDVRDRAELHGDAQPFEDGNGEGADEDGFDGPARHSAVDLGRAEAIDLTDDVVADREDEDDGDELLLQAMEIVVTSQLGSTSMLQRKLRVGFARAGRIMDLLEERNVVGPSQGSKAREVLLSPEDWHKGHRRR